MLPMCLVKNGFVAVILSAGPLRAFNVLTCIENFQYYVLGIILIIPCKMMLIVQTHNIKIE